MNKLSQLIILILVSLTFNTFAKDGFVYQFENDLTNFYRSYVNNDGLVNYTEIKNNGDQLENLVTMINNINLDNVSEHLQAPYLTNVYNVLVIKTVVENYPIKSVMDVEGFFKTRYNVGGKNISLDELEKKYILKSEEDFMIHFALVCAAKGCPKLINKPYTTETFDTNISDNAIGFLNDPQNLEVNENTVTTSSIFDWYKNDFGGTQGVLDFLQQFSSKEISSSSTINYSNYDWSLNDQKGERR